MAELFGNRTLNISLQGQIIQDVCDQKLIGLS